MIGNRLSWYMETNNYFNKFQSGFRRGRSCIDHILRLQDDIHKANNSRGYTVGVFLDLEKAFDLVWKDGILFKLQQLGLSGNIYKWISDFLSHRTIQVRIGNTLSNSYTLQNGSPRAALSVLYYFLF